MQEPTLVHIVPSPTALVRVVNVALEQVAQVQQEAARRARQEPRGKIGSFQATYYYIANEDTEASGRKNTSLYTPRCKRITKVSRKFAKQAALQGTAQLSDGRTINVARRCDCGFSPCFFVARHRHPWGVGAAGVPLSPFRSIAVDPRHISYGTKLYIAELDGLTMPGSPPWGGFVHDGCVVAHDTGGGIRGRQVDLFFARKQAYRSFKDRHRITRVTVYDGEGRCEHLSEAIARHGDSI